MPNQIAGLEKQIATSQSTIAKIDASGIERQQALNILNHHETLIKRCQSLIKRMGVSA